MGAYFDIESHRRMIFDEARNLAYARALNACVKPGCTVLDLGAGLGIHGLMAAKLGAGKVYLVDPSPVVQHAAEVARANGVDDRIEIIRKRIEDVQIPQPVDLIVSVFTGNFLLTEDLLPLLFNARDRFLKPGGQLVPGRARMRLAPVSAAGFHEDRVACWSGRPANVDFGPLRRFASNQVFYTGIDDLDFKQLSKPATLTEIDFTAATSAHCKARVEIEVDDTAACHGLLGWFEMELGGEWISTGPQAEAMHWSLAFLPLDPVIELKKGQVVACELDRPEFGEWTWTVECEGEKQRHSTFQSRMPDLGTLKAQADGFVPGISGRGRLARHVLAAMAEGRPTGEIVASARAMFADDFDSMEGQLDRIVRKLIANWKAEQG